MGEKIQMKMGKLEGREQEDERIKRKIYNAKLGKSEEGRHLYSKLKGIQSRCD